MEGEDFVRFEKHARFSHGFVEASSAVNKLDSARKRGEQEVTTLLASSLTIISSYLSEFVTSFPNRNTETSASPSNHTSCCQNRD